MIPDSHFENDGVVRRPENWLQIGDIAVRYSALLEVSSQLTEHLRRLFTFQFAGLSLHNPSADTMYLVIQDDITCEPSPIELPVEGTIGGWVWKNQSPLVFHDVQDESRFSLSVDVMKGLGIRSLCKVPLTTAQRRLGALWLASTNGDLYGETDVQRLSQMAGLVSLALEKALLCASLQEAKDRLDTMLNVSATVMTHLSVDEVVPAVSALIQPVVTYDYASLALYEKATGALRVHDLGGEPSQEAPEPEMSVLLQSTSDPVFLHGEVRVRGREELTQTGASLAQQIADCGIESLCSLPLISRNGTFGVLNLGTRQQHGFVSQDLNFLQHAAAQIATALDNAFAYHEIEKLAKALKTEKFYRQ